MLGGSYLNQKELKILQLLFTDFIEGIKREVRKKDLKFEKYKLYFDEQNRHDFFRSFSRKENNERVKDSNPSIFKFLESCGYDENGKVINISFPYETIDDSEGLKIFVDKFRDKFPEMNSLEDGSHLLGCIFGATLQEYSDINKGLSSIIDSDVNYNLLFKLLDKYINFLQNTHCEVEIFIPILGETWIKGSSVNNLDKKFDENISLRLLTIEEQEARVYGGITNLIGDEPLVHEDEYNISKSNTMIVIKDIVEYRKIGFNEFEDNVYEVYKKHYLKINALLNFISLTSEYNSISVERVYFKCDGYLFNYYGLPISLWNKLEVPNKYSIDLSQRARNTLDYFSENDNYFLNENHLNASWEIYNKLYQICSKKNKEKIEGALLRRTRAKMDFSETEGLLDAVIGVEQLFSSSQTSELSFRISLYVSNILYETKGFENSSKKDIFNEFKKMYKKRSSFVHAGLGTTDEKSLLYLESLIREIMISGKYDLSLNCLIATQTENIYLFNEFV